MLTVQHKPQDDAAMSFSEIGEQIGMSTAGVRKVYYRALRKLRASMAAIDVLIELSEYHHQLRARSIECQAAREHW
jgi:hypothetical protein